MVYCNSSCKFYNVCARSNVIVSVVSLYTETCMADAPHKHIFKMCNCSYGEAYCLFSVFGKSQG